MALGEWLRQVRVGTSVLRQRAANVAVLMASRELVALKLESKTHSALVIERNWLRNDFFFLGGKAPRVKELFRGNAVELLLQRNRLRAEADLVQVVAAPWKFFEGAPGTVKWHRFLSARLPVAPTLEEQLQQVRSKTQRQDLQAALKDTGLAFSVSRSRADFDRFYSQLYAPFTRQGLGARGAVLEPKEELARDFADGGTLVFVTRKGRLVAGALLLGQRRNGLVFHRSGFAQAGGLGPRELAARVAALDLAVFRYAHDEKLGWVDFGDTSSVLTDPQFVDRRQLGCTFVATPASPALMLEVSAKVKPLLFSAAPMLTGDPGDFVAQTGLSRAGKAQPQLKKIAAQFEGAGIVKVVLSTDAPRDLPARVRQEKLLREGAVGLELELDEIKPPRPSAR